MPTLILTPRFTEDSQSLWQAAIDMGWCVERLRSWRVPEELRGLPDPVLYLEALFGPALAPHFGLRLVEPDPAWLPNLPDEFRKRRIALMPCREARKLINPAFMKPPNDKSFAAQVCTGVDLPKEYDDEAPVLVAEIVRWEIEFRCFVLDREPQTISIYLRNGQTQRELRFAASESELAEAEAFVRTVLADHRVDLPRAAVLDVGVIVGRGWAVVEQNAAWGAGIYGCDPQAVLRTLRHAALPV